MRARTNFCTDFSLVFEKTTNTCFGHLADKIATRFEKGLFTGIVLVNLQKAFDDIDHQILLKKMNYLGFSKNTVTWFKSYLCERKFKISINTSVAPVL